MVRLYCVSLKKEYEYWLAHYFDTNCEDEVEVGILMLGVCFKSSSNSMTLQDKFLVGWTFDSDAELFFSINWFSF